jgi:hypothetical protein
MSLNPLTISRRLLWSGLLLTASPLCAQPAEAPGQAKKQAEEQAQAAYHAAVENAKTQAKGQDLAGAEETLGALNQAKANTAAWHLETAQRLVQLAEQLARDAAPQNVAALVRSALQHLKKAEQKATNPTERLNAKLLAGFIHERFLGDSSAAVAEYEAAVALAPESTQAKEAATRAKKTDENFRNKSKSN